jgi:hypothetical protein
VLFTVAALTAACGVPTQAAPPTAKEVLAKPQKSDLKDAHFNVTGKITDNGTTVELVGDGAVTYSPNWRAASSSRRTSAGSRSPSRKSPWMGRTTV